MAICLSLLMGCSAQRPHAPRDVVADTPTSNPMYAGSQGTAVEFALPVHEKPLVQIKVDAHLLSCNLHNAPLGEVVKLIGEQTGLQFVYRGRLHSRISANLADVPLDTALNKLFQATPYDAILDGNTYFINYREPSDGHGKPIVQEVFFQYIEVDHALEGLRAAYDRVSDPVVGFGRLPGNNGIFVVAPSAYMDGILEFLQNMDRELPQVLIEALVVEFFSTNILEFGIDIAEGSSGEVSELNFSPGSPLAPLLSFLFQEDAGAMDKLRARITALDEQEKAHIVSRPYIVTRSGREAIIMSQEILTVRSEQLASGERLLSTDDIKAGTRLAILPTVNVDRTVTLNLDLEQSEFVRGFGASEAGVVARRLEDKASLSLNVKDGETIVLGGFVRTEGTETFTSIPLISRIPLLRRLFGQYQDLERESEVVFILTPHILPIDFKKFYQREIPDYSHK